MFAPAVERVLKDKDYSLFERRQMAGAMLTQAVNDDPELGERALVALYNLQTKAEKKALKTIGRNGRGLSKSVNVPKVADLVERIERGDKLLRHADYIAGVICEHRDQFFSKMTVAQRRRILATPCRMVAADDSSSSSSAAESSVTEGDSGTESEDAVSTDDECARTRRATRRSARKGVGI